MVERLEPLWTFQEFIPSDDGEYVRYSDYSTLSARVAQLEEALQAMLREHDILSGNYGDIMDPKHKRPDRCPTAAAMARAALSEKETR